MTPLPGSNLSFPRDVVRVCFGERYKRGGTWTVRRLDHLFLGRLAEPRTIGRQVQRDNDDPRQYRRDEKLMALLAEEHSKASCDRCCAGYSGDIAEFRPVWVPIRMVADDPRFGWTTGMSLHFGPRWACRCGGPWRAKTDAEVEADAEALESYHVPVETALAMTEAERLQSSLLVVGERERRESKRVAKGKYEVTAMGPVSRDICNPATCKFYWPHDRDAIPAACEESGTLTFLLPFVAGEDQWAFWRTRGRRSCQRVTTTLAVAATQARGHLAGIPLRLRLSVEPVTLRDGTLQNQPIGNIDMALNAEEIAALSEGLHAEAMQKALAPYHTGDMLALTPDAIPEAHERAMLPEWQPTVADNWQATAYEEIMAAGVPDSAAEAWITEAEKERDPLAAVRARIDAHSRTNGHQDRDAEPETQPAPEEQPLLVEWEESDG